MRPAVLIHNVYFNLRSHSIVGSSTRQTQEKSKRRAMGGKEKEKEAWQRGKAFVESA